MNRGMKISILVGAVTAFVAGFFLPGWGGAFAGIVGMFIAAGIHDWKASR